MDLRSAKVTDFEQVAAFYKYAINNTKDMSTYARWVYGQHPTNRMIMEYIEQDAMYILEDGETIVAAMAVTMFQGADYHNISWCLELKDDEVAVVHILCVSLFFELLIEDRIQKED